MEHIKQGIFYEGAYERLKNVPKARHGVEQNADNFVLNHMNKLGRFNSFRDFEAARYVSTESRVGIYDMLFKEKINSLYYNLLDQDLDFELMHTMQRILHVERETMLERFMTLYQGKKMRRDRLAW